MQFNQTGGTRIRGILRGDPSAVFRTAPTNDISETPVSTEPRINRIRKRSTGPGKGPDGGTSMPASCRREILYADNTRPADVSGLGTPRLADNRQIRGTMACCCRSSPCTCRYTTGAVRCSGIDQGEGTARPGTSCETSQHDIPASRGRCTPMIGMATRVTQPGGREAFCLF